MGLHMKSHLFMTLLLSPVAINCHKYVAKSVLCEFFYFGWDTQRKQFPHPNLSEIDGCPSRRPGIRQ